MKDPNVRADGMCAYCGGPRTVPPTRQRGIPIEAYTNDPFCSNVCAKAYYNTQDSPPESAGRKPGMVKSDHAST